MATKIQLEDLINLSTKFNDVIFYDENHSYYHKKTNKRLTSVTTLINKYKPKFDANAKAEEMSLREDEERSKSEILKEWSDIATKSQIKGTGFHNYAEDFSQNKVFPNNVLKKLKDMFHAFYARFIENNIVAKPELLVYDEEHQIAGQIDLLALNLIGNYLYIMDYKTNKKMNKNSPYGNYMLEPLVHLEECEINIYSLQMSLYRYIIEKNLGIELGDSIILWFFEENENCKVYKCKYMKEEVEAILELRKKELNGY